MLTALLERLEPEEYQYFRERLAHARISSDIGFIAEAYESRICQVTGIEDDALNAFFSIETPNGRRFFMIDAKAGMTRAEFFAVNVQDLEALDRTLAPL